MASTPRTLSTILVALFVLLVHAACPPSSQQAHPEWQVISVDYGQGNYRLPVRYHWVAVRTKNGVEITSVDGGKGTVRLFACAEQIGQVRARIRRQLRDRFIGSSFKDYTRVEEDGKEVTTNVFSFSWRQSASMTGKVNFTAIAYHGPLLIAVTSATMQPDDVTKIAAHTRLDLPLPTIQSCLPVCLGPKACKIE
jgi:predicted RNA binding protein with dsRBD fold (UPF0201 family)